MHLTCQAEERKRSIGIFQRGKAGLDIDMSWLVFSSALLSSCVAHNQTVPGWAHAPRDGFVLGIPPYHHINANRLKKRQALVSAFLEVVCWVWAVGQHCTSCSFGHAEARHEGADWWEVGERLVGEMKAGETPRQHVKLGPQAHLCPWCQCRPQCHCWVVWTWVMASVLFNYRPLCLVMWYMCLVLFIPCNLTQRSWADPKLPPRAGCPWHASSRALHPEGFCQHVSEHPCCNTLTISLSLHCFGSKLWSFFPDACGRLCLSSDALERTW